MICERCFLPIEHGDHGVGLCPLEPRPAHAVWQDDIPGGLAITNALCNEDGSPRTFYSRSEIRAACQAKGILPWTDVYTEDRTKDARVHDDWLRSGEAQRARRDRVDARAEKALQRARQERRA